MSHGLSAARTWPARPDLVAFVTSQFVTDEKKAAQPAGLWKSPPCDTYGCALLQWARQAHAVASQVRQRSGEGASVHLFTPCLSPDVGPSLSAGDDAVRVVVHPQHHGGLRRALGLLRSYAIEHNCCSEWKSVNLYMMLRWEIFAMEREARVVVYLDLDLELLPRWSAALLLELPARAAARSSDEVVVATGRDWAALIACASRSQYGMLSYPDHSSPVHGALLVARPNTSLFRDGIALIKRTAASGPFDTSTGWDRLGPPHVAVPPSDHIWRRRRGHTSLIDRDHWGFVNGETDQGLLFHMTRVRHHLGADLRLSECAAAPPSASAARRRPVAPETNWFHYGATGGSKPDAVVRRWQWLMEKRMCGRVKSLHYFADGAEVMLRSLLWARRTAAEVDHLRKAAHAQGSEGRAQLETCAAALRTGFECVHTHLAAFPNASVNLGGMRVPNRLRGRTLRVLDVLAPFLAPDAEWARAPRTHLPSVAGGPHGFLGRAISLLADYRSIGGAYNDVPRVRCPRASDGKCRGSGQD